MLLYYSKSNIGKRQLDHVFIEKSILQVGFLEHLFSSYRPQQYTRYCIRIRVTVMKIFIPTFVHDSQLTISTNDTFPLYFHYNPFALEFLVKFSLVLQKSLMHYFPYNPISSMEITRQSFFIELLTIIGTWET